MEPRTLGSRVIGSAVGLGYLLLFNKLELSGKGVGITLLAGELGTGTEFDCGSWLVSCIDDKSQGEHTEERHNVLLELVDHDLGGLDRAVAGGRAENLGQTVLAADESGAECGLILVATDNDIWMNVSYCLKAPMMWSYRRTCTCRCRTASGHYQGSSPSAHGSGPPAWFRRSRNGGRGDVYFDAI
jgi:hypothetical protein